MVQTSPDSAQSSLADTFRSSTWLVQTRSDAAQALWQTPPGAGHSSVVQTRPDAAQASVV